MTSITFSSKGLKAMYQWALKRNQALSVVLSVILFFTGPFFCFYLLSTKMFKAGNIVIEEILQVSIVMYTVTIMFFTLMSGVKTFSYLHNKRSTDMFCSMPCNRTAMFIAHLLGGITALGVPYVVGSLCVMGICARTKEEIIMCLVTILSNVLMLIASYLLTAIVAYCCGTIIDTIIITLAINGIWVVAVMVWFGILEELVPGMTFESILNSIVLVLFAPYGFGFAGFVSYTYFDGVQDNTFFISLIIWAVVLIAIEFVAGLFLANRRKSEVAQNGFAAGWLPMAIKAGLSVVAGAVIGFMAAEITESGYGNMYAYTFWYILGSLCAFFIFHIIFSRGIKKDLGKSAIVYSVTTVASLVLIFCMSYGCGIDTYVPSKANVRSVELTDYYSYTNDAQNEYTSDECIDIILEMHKIITEGIRKEYEYPYYIGTNYSEDYYDSYTLEVNAVDEPSTATTIDESLNEKYKYLTRMSFSFQYDLKFGFDVSRVYCITRYDSEYYDIDRLNELAKQFMNTDEYKRNQNNHIFDDKCREGRSFIKAEICEGYFDDYDYEYQEFGKQTINIDDSSFVDGLCEALKKDILADKDYYPYSGWRVGSSGESSTVLKIYTAYDNSIDDLYWWVYDDSVPAEKSKYNLSYYRFITVEIKDTYTNTWNYLGMSSESGADFTDIASCIDDYHSYAGSYDSWVSDISKPWAMSLCETYEIEYAAWATQYRVDYDSMIYNAVNVLLADSRYSTDKDDDLILMTQTIYDCADRFVELSAYEMKNGGKSDFDFDVNSFFGTDSDSDTDTGSKTESSEPTETSSAQLAAA